MTPSGRRASAPALRTLPSSFDCDVAVPRRAAEPGKMTGMSDQDLDEVEAAMARRVRPTESGTELQTLTQLLDFLRATVIAKATGITDEQAAAHPVPASGLTIAGLVKHLTGTERFWFSIDFADLQVPWPWTDGNPHGNFTLSDTETIDFLRADYELECERSRQAIAGQPLDAVARSEGMKFTLRYALAHMVEETARHCGHLDLLRESIDGRKGQ